MTVKTFGHLAHAHEKIEEVGVNEMTSMKFYT